MSRTGRTEHGDWERYFDRLQLWDVGLRVSVQLKTVIIVIFTLAGDEPACPGCDTPVTGVHAWQRLGMTSPTAVRQPSFHPCPTHTLTRTEVYRQSHTFTVTLFSCLYGIDCRATFVSLGPLCVPVDWEKWQLCDGWIIAVPILSSWNITYSMCMCVTFQSCYTFGNGPNSCGRRVDI